MHKLCSFNEVGTLCKKITEYNNLQIIFNINSIKNKDFSTLSKSFDDIINCR